MRDPALTTRYEFLVQGDLSGLTVVEMRRIDGRADSVNERARIPAMARVRF